MNSKDVVKVIIVVTSKDAFVVDYPDEIECLIDGYNCEYNFIENIPREKGMYECDLEYWFEQAYCDGYPADGESEWGFKIINSKKVY